MQPYAPGLRILGPTYLFWPQIEPNLGRFVSEFRLRTPKRPQETWVAPFVTYPYGATQPTLYGATQPTDQFVWVAPFDCTV